MPSQINFAPLRAVGPDGKGLPGALARFYETGSTTPITVYTDGGLGTAYAVPLVADAQGVFAPVFTDGATSVKVEVTTAAGVTVNGFPVDPAQLISSTGSAATAVSFAPITGNAATDVQQAVRNNTIRQNTAEDFGGTSPFASAAQGLKADSALPSSSVLDQDDFATNSETKPPSQQSVKAYADNISTKAIGKSQTWQNVAGSRVANTSYQNTTGKPIQVSLIGSSGADIQVSSDDSTWITIGKLGTPGVEQTGVTAIIPDNYHYKTTGAFNIWAELRA